MFSGENNRPISIMIILGRFGVLGRAQAGADQLDRLRGEGRLVGQRRFIVRLHSAVPGHERTTNELPRIQDPRTTL